jgi:PhnB protein
MSVPTIPPGYHTITPGITCRDAAKAIDFYKEAFGATEVMRMADPDGRIMHAELKIGDSHVFVGDEYPGMSAAPAPGAIPSQSLYLYVDNVDALHEQALAAGGSAAMPVADMFWGDRMSKVIDPFGHHWSLATHIEDVAPEEMDRRSRQWLAQMANRAMAAGQSGS